jgi:hypothetical protein
MDATPVPGPEFRWSGTTCRLRVRDVRLVVEGTGRGRGSTEFVVDTGSSQTTVSSGSSLYRETRMCPTQTGLVRGLPAFSGILPSISLGGLHAADVPVQAWDQPHSLAAPANLLGMSHLRGVVICHRREDRSWWMSNGRGASPCPDGPDWLQVDFVAPGLPVVEVETPEGGRAYALIDTGSPSSVVVSASGRTGRHVVRSRDGRVALVIDARERVSGLEGVRVGGRPIRLMIGLETLASRTFTLDLGASAWRLAPR